MRLRGRVWCGPRGCECWSVGGSGPAVFCLRPGGDLGFPNCLPSCCSTQNSRALSPDPRAKVGEGDLKIYAIPTGGKVGAVQQGPTRRRAKPVWLREEELRPISCHGGRVSGVGGQLRRCPLRVWIVGLDEGDVAQQRGVGRAENLLSHLQWVVRRHLSGVTPQLGVQGLLIGHPSCPLWV